MPRLPLEPMEKNLVFLPLLAIDDALIVPRLLQPARLRASAVGMKNLRSTASGFRAPRASGVPHALFGREINQRLGRIASRGRERVFAVIARSEATKQSILSLRQDGLLRCARNDGARDGMLRFARNDGRGDGMLRGACHRARIRATRWLAMTVLCSGRQNGLLRNFEPFSPYRHGSSTALVMPIRNPVM